MITRSADAGHLLGLHFGGPEHVTVELGLFLLIRGPLLLQHLVLRPQVPAQHKRQA